MKAAFAIIAKMSRITLEQNRKSERNYMCTGIKVNYDNGCVLGRTMDFEAPIEYNALYLPRGYKYCIDLMGKPLYSKYMMLGMVFRNRDPLKDGVNEHGLVGITNDFGGFNLYSSKTEPEKVNISSMDYFNYALANYKSVDELLQDLPNINISTRDNKGDNVLCPDFHFMFSDPTKRCIVVEPKQGRLVGIDNPYDVMTNSPGLESQTRRLKHLMDIENLDEFNSSKDLPGGYDPVSRFIKAFYLTRMNIPASNYKEAYSNFYNIISAMTMPNGFVRNRKYNSTTYTRYTCAYDTEYKLMTVKTDMNPMIYQLSFEDIIDKEKRHHFFLGSEFESKKLTEKMGK